MIEVKKNKLTKTNLAIIVTSIVLVVLIAGYVILSAIISSLSGKENQQSAQNTPPIELKEGEALYGSSPVAYEYLKSSAIVSVGVAAQHRHLAAIDAHKGRHIMIHHDPGPAE